MAVKQSDGSTPGNYPDRQKDRQAGGDRIEAKVFREKDAASRAEKTGPARGYDTQPKGY